MQVKNVLFFISFSFFIATSANANNSTSNINHHRTVSLMLSPQGKPLSSSSINPSLPCVMPGRRIALTFDDGPTLRRTENILKILSDHHIHATFFLVGLQILKFPNVVKEIISDGNVVGVHTFDHHNLWKLSTTAQNQEIQKDWALIHNLEPLAPIHFWRAPYGNIPYPLPSSIEKLGLTHVYWSIDTVDWSNPPFSLWKTRAFAALHRSKNQIILMHDHTADTQKGISNLINALQANHDQIVTMDQFLAPTCKKLIANERITYNEKVLKN